MIKSRFFFVLVAVSSFLGFSNQSAAEVLVDVNAYSWSGGRASIDLEMTNKSDTTISSARVWVFLMDTEGKVVGNHSEWLFGGGAERADDEIEPIESGEEAVISFSFPAEKPLDTARVTFSRIIDDSGKTLNLNKLLKVSDRTSSENEGN